MALALNQTALVDFGSLALTGYPFTMVGWFRVPAAGVLMTLMRIDNTATTSYHALVYEGNSSGQAAVVSKVGATGAARTTIAMAPGQWHHVVGVFEAHDSRRVYFDGGNMGAGAHSRVFDGANQFRAGNISGAAAIDTAEVAVFAAVLIDAEIGMLARGCPVLSLPRASNLLAYHSLVRAANHPGFGIPATVSGSPAVVEHPRVLMAGGGRTLAQPCRTCGPFQLDQTWLRSSFVDRGQLALPGIVDDAGQPSVAGVASGSSTLYGEAHS